MKKNIELAIDLFVLAFYVVVYTVIACAILYILVGCQKEPTDTRPQVIQTAKFYTKPFTWDKPDTIIVYKHDKNIDYTAYIGLKDDTIPVNWKQVSCLNVHTVTWRIVYGESK